MKKIVMVVAAFATLALSFSACKKVEKVDDSLNALKERGVFVLGLDASFPPMGYTDDDGNIIGYDIDLAKEVASRLGVEFKAQPIDWDAKEMELSTGKIDCIWNGFTMSEERSKALAFTRPYLANDQVVVVKKDSVFNNLKDLAGKKVGLQTGSSAQDAVEGNEEFKNSLKELVYFKDNMTALNDLAVGGIDAVVMDSVVANYSIAQTKKPLRLLSESLAKESYGVGFRKNDVKLRDEVQKILDEMEQDGTVANISTKWFGSNISVISK